jgi:hypothetical protein
VALPPSPTIHPTEERAEPEHDGRDDEPDLDDHGSLLPRSGRRAQSATGVIDDACVGIRVEQRCGDPRRRSQYVALASRAAIHRGQQDAGPENDDSDDDPYEDNHR